MGVPRVGRALAVPTHLCTVPAELLPMRFLVATAAFVVGLAATGDARAQYASDPAHATIDCAGDSVATDLAGVPVAAPEEGAESGSDAARAPNAPPVLDLGVCSDARDPRCAPLTPERDPSGFAPLGSVERFVDGASVNVAAAVFVVLPSVSYPVPDRTDGSTGVRMTLDRPPRAA